jgi:8-oxo-dGTP diphosphatase
MRIKDIQKAIIVREGKYLILLRSPKAKFFPEHWDFPGGKLEENESPKEGIKREVIEETGLNVEIGEVVGIYEMNLEPDVVHKFTVYSVLEDTGEVKLSHEHTEFKWVTKDELLKLKVEPYIRQHFGK